MKIITRPEFYSSSSIISYSVCQSVNQGVNLGHTRVTLGHQGVIMGLPGVILDHPGIILCFLRNWCSLRSSASAGIFSSNLSKPTKSCQDLSSACGATVNLSCDDVKKLLAICDKKLPTRHCLHVF